MDVKNAPAFEFPPKHEKLKFNMSNVWGGECSREIGFTLRCGGRGSGIHDRRNWDAYMVDGKVRYLGPAQGKRMMGFSEAFELPEAETSAMKQLGNSVAVDAIREVGKTMIAYMKKNLHMHEDFYTRT